MTSRLQIAGVTLAAAVALFSASGSASAPQQREDMMARMASFDARIEMLTAEMNSFTGEMRIDAMAALLNALVEERQAMRSAMTGMRQPRHPQMQMHHQPDPATP